MPKINRKRICIVTHSLDGGGAEKSSAELSKMLYDIGHEIYIVSVMPEVTYDYKGELLNLGEFKSRYSGWYSRLVRFFRLKKFIRDKKIDLIIDSRPRNVAFREFIISKFVYRVKDDLCFA